MNISLLTSAASFAAIAHSADRRKNVQQSPYIEHPLRVGDRISSLGRITDCEVIAASYLHDVVEDTDITDEDIRAKFGDNVANIVKEVTDDRTLSKLDRKKNQVKNAPGKSYQAKLVKLADKLDNLSDLINEVPQGWTEQSRYGYFIWCYFVIAGLRGTNEYLEKALDDLYTEIIPLDELQDAEYMEEQLKEYYDKV